ncbi:hypothetical protein [Solibacillus sp. FSL H8-0538]|uniref:hypothetical protein n=1 Tax=Solibacillus sp. FSL H8-0538 TaxID=2921400 RepID=UPI0030F6EBB0
MLSKQEVDALLAQARKKPIRKANQADLEIVVNHLNLMLAKHQQAGLPDAVENTRNLIENIEHCNFEVQEETKKNITFSF